MNMTPVGGYCIKTTGVHSVGLAEESREMWNRFSWGKKVLQLFITMVINGSHLNSSAQDPSDAALSRPPWVTTTLGCFLIFTIVVDILGNLLVIFSVFRNKKLRNAGELQQVWESISGEGEKKWRYFERAWRPWAARAWLLSCDTNKTSVSISKRWPWREPTPPDHVH